MVNRVTSIFISQVIILMPTLSLPSLKGVHNKSLSKLKVPSLLGHREDFWILKQQTLSPQGLNISLIILKALLDPSGYIQYGYIETRFHTSSCSFHTLSNLITWMSFANFYLTSNIVKQNIINNTCLYHKKWPLKNTVAELSHTIILVFYCVSSVILRSKYI